MFNTSTRRLINLVSVVNVSNTTQKLWRSKHNNRTYEDGREFQDIVRPISLTISSSLSINQLVSLDTTKSVDRSEGILEQEFGTNQIVRGLRDLSLPSSPLAVDLAGSKPSA
ncbi:hypothetical protein RRG08_035394 [Elysia crispata]|uniref:Uncharacterized protein n=1 Tax=Elysia crispata TaxID=231223 RepID=A0AAE1CRY4_9GAST|nr:hypothetical protein RRG08_035394 [Elysia crispata]